MGNSSNNSIENAKNALNSIIKKSRVHFYKPIQIAEILYQHRVYKKINLEQLENYRNTSKKWRDRITQKFLGRICTSSAKFQDNLFESNAMPPKLLAILGDFNKQQNGIVEAHIYKSFSDKYFQLNNALDYCLQTQPNSFKLDRFINLFWNEAGLKRSIDKILEIVVYALFETILTNAGIKIEIVPNDPNQILDEFSEFAEKVIGLNNSNQRLSFDAHFHRVGVTNAADRGLDIFANFGAVVQIKHLNLSEEIAEGITEVITANKIVIVCKNAEAKVISSLLTQIGWRSRIQSIITIEELSVWYDRALTGKHYLLLGENLLENIREQIQLEFPSVGNNQFEEFIQTRGYHQIQHDNWKSFYNRL
ncbi:MAG: HaeII family restriction endonuclease [Crocosphaera sp.]